MTPAKRLATLTLEVISPNSYPYSKEANMRFLAKKILVKRTASPAKAWKPKTDTRPARRKAHRESTEEIRKAVFARAKGWSGIPLCELCSPRVRWLATELAHLESGVGRRRQRQSIENTAASCRRCNEDWDAYPERRLMMASSWSENTGLPIPRGILGPG